MKINTSQAVGQEINVRRHCASAPDGGTGANARQRIPLEEGCCTTMNAAVRRYMAWRSSGRKKRKHLQDIFSKPVAIDPQTP